MTGRVLKVTILGCGSSSGVPKIGNDWGDCDPANPLNRRRRSSILVEIGPEDGPWTTVLIDSSPDLREQFLSANVTRLDAVVYTHDHADQTHGIDDLRHIAYAMRKPILTYLSRQTAGTLMTRFSFCFDTGERRAYPPILDHRIMEEPYPAFAIDGPGGPLPVLPFDLDHGTIRSLGFRFGPVAYSPDVLKVPDDSFARLEGLDCWICDAIRWDPHPTHSHVNQTLSWFDRMGVARGVLTNLHIYLDYEALKAYVPGHVIPAHDGMVLTFPVE